MPKANTFAAYFSAAFGYLQSNLTHKGNDYVASVNEDELISFYYDVYSLPEIALKNAGQWEAIPAKPSMSHSSLDSVKATVRFDAEYHPRIEETLRICSKEFPSPPFSVDDEGFHCVANLSTSSAVELLDGFKQAIAKVVDQVNAAVRAGNAGLKSRITLEVSARKQKLASQASVLKELSSLIPLKFKVEATSPIVPLAKKKQIVINPPKPKLSIQPKIDTKILGALVSVLIKGGLLFESAPETFSKLDEDELRNILVSILNGNFEIHAVAEAFNRLGKTDISLPYSGDNLFVAECKYWYGASAYSDAIAQLFRYLQWRQSLGVILCFSKEKNFSTIIQNRNDAITSLQDSFVPGSFQSKDERGTYVISKHVHPDDKGKTVDIHHLIFTLYYDKTQVGLTSG